ncbi:hypothetical protein F4679DRAFT_528248 [Xylaria curta]|nr:hypothetical protein F4679DRAFT_528248 [Xylaria curta]
MPQNAIIAILVIFFVLIISVVFWKGKKVVERFAHEMFSAKQAEQQLQHRRAASSEAPV